ncbi:hypothetical protein PybrP1_010740 [[Pythium] brassicae (nom. inval.)]|nr:hypothetical protein PybrP1_010740 [[Pythium] brassicae (nom. inval.)]
MIPSRSTALLFVAAALTATTASATPSLRALAAPAKLAFEWRDDPHAADPCTEPGCVNHVKYGYTVVPLTISSDAKVVIQVADRPAGLAAVLSLETYTQPGCAISGCKTTKVLGIFPKEECFNVQVRKVADQPDGATARIDFGGIYYENLPSGELYVKYERQNYLTDADTCTYEVRSGFKRWF